MYPPIVREKFEKFLVSRNPVISDMFDNIVPETKERWTKKFNNYTPALSTELKLNGRRMNNFMVGSDPEFCFVDPNYTNQKVAAAHFGMRPALAMGADQNQRLVELRPAPAVSVVEHVAGILSALRWMVRIYPTCVPYQWRAGAYHAGDGLGGHVHFGRKRNTRDDEVEGLDGLARTFRVLNVFPNDEWRRRSNGDERHQVYGAYGDYRKQAHGYEYRTLPSWLTSPLLAFAVITASKLVVLDPSISKHWVGKATPAQALQNLINLCKLYAGRDDDALILHDILLKKRLMSHSQLGLGASCFKEAWGLKNAPVEAGNFPVVPAMIRPATEEIAQMHEFLTKGTELTFYKAPVNFVSSIPKDYLWLYPQIPQVARAGIGDFFHDLVVHNKGSFNVMYRDREGGSSFPSKLVNPNSELGKQLRDEFNMYPNGDNQEFLISTSILGNLAQMRTLKRILVKSGLFPIWTIDTVKADSYTDFLERVKLPAPATPYVKTFKETIL